MEGNAQPVAVCHRKDRGQGESQVGGELRGRDVEHCNRATRHRFLMDDTSIYWLVILLSMGRVGTSRARIVGVNPGMLGSALAFIAFTAWLCSGYAVGPLDLGAIIQGPAFFGLISGLIALIASCRVKVTSQSVELVDILFITTVPFVKIQSVEAENGLSILTSDGSRFGSVAYGSSVLAAITGSRRATRLRARLEGALAGSLPGSDPDSNAVIRRRFRVGVVLIPALLVGGAVLYTATLRTI